MQQPCDAGVVLSGKPAFPCGPKSQPWILAATILASSTAFIDSTVVNVALPAAVRFVWNEAGEQRSMVVKVNDCEYQSFIANIRWIVGARWQEIGRELK